MSIQTELTRITNAKTAIKAAIEGKGVTVHAGTKIDGMAALIESIEAGGGGGGGIPTPFSKFTTGTFLLASLTYTNTYPITHGLGIAPKAFLIFLDEPGPYFGAAINHLCYIDDVNTNARFVVGFVNSKQSSAQWAEKSYVLVDENTFTLNASNEYFSSNRTYRWVAIA